MYLHASFALVLAIATSTRVAADQTVTIDPDTKWGTWDGWGTSLAWWAKRFGDRSDLADIFFSQEYTMLNNQSIPGLGLNIVRYNAGASSSVAANGESMVVGKDTKESRLVEGFWLNWNNADIYSDSWNWDVDVKQRSMLIKARNRGVTKFELFSNSPMWWMLRNHNPSGADDGSDNLQEHNYKKHAEYLAAVAKYAKENWGVSFESVEPFNEPMANWWKGENSMQEGCHVSIKAQVSVINHLRSELDRHGLKFAMVAASDENTYDQALRTAWGLGSTLKKVGRINVHGYQGKFGQRDGLYDYASSWKKPLWNTEYGENDVTGEQLASNLILDFRWLHLTAWAYWQVLDHGGWGLIDANNDDGTIGAVSQKYYVLAQFTRHIRPGMVIIDGGSDTVVAAYDEYKKKLVIVAVNWGEEQYLTFDLSNFEHSSAQAQVTRWSTQIGSGDQYVRHSDTTMQGSRFWSKFQKYTVQTFEINEIRKK